MIQTNNHARKFIIEEKLRRGFCLDCGLVVDQSNWIAFDFDHRDPELKLFNLSELTGIVKQRIEASKCDLVCAVCHRIRGHKRNDCSFRRSGKSPQNDLQPTLFDLSNISHPHDV